MRFRPQSLGRCSYGYTSVGTCGRAAKLLDERTQPAQVQFYTNSNGQIKIGTDTVFAGVITAPFGQIYAFPRTQINGNLLGRSVWVDAESTVQFVQNCTEFNGGYDDTERNKMCSNLSFETDLWIPVDGGAGSEIGLSDMNISDGENALEIALYDEPYLNIEATTNIRMPFTQEAQAISVTLDVYSNAAPYSQWGAEIGVYLKGVDNSSYQLAGTMAYNPEDMFAEEMETLMVNLSAELSQLVIENEVQVMLQFSAMQSDAFFEIDRLQFCDDQGACNITCPSLLPDDYIAPVEPGDMYVNQWVDGDSSIMEDVPSLGGTIHTTDSREFNSTVELVLENIFGETETIPLGDARIGPQDGFSFNVAAADLPFKTIGMIATATVKVTTHYPLGDGTTRDIEEHVSQRYYTHKWWLGTITHFNEQEFHETFNGIGFQKNDESVGVRIYDEEGNLAGFVLEAGFEEVDDEQTDTDSDTGPMPE